MDPSKSSVNREEALQSIGIATASVNTHLLIKATGTQTSKQEWVYLVR